MRRFVRSLITALLIAAAVQCFTIWGLASSLPGQVGAPNIHEIREFRYPRIKRIRLANEDGSVQVPVHELDEVRVEASINAYVKSRHDLPMAQAFVASLVRTDSDGTLLDVITEPEERPDVVDLQVDYTFIVPAGTDVAIEGSNGNVWISKGCGQVDVKGRNTDIEIVEPSGPVFAQSTNGRIRVLDAPESATLRTINGNVYVYMLGGTLTASTTNGAIIAYMLDPRIEACDLSSHNGGITLVMNEDCSAAVEAVTTRGFIASDYQVECENGIRKRRHLRGTIGEGHTRLHMDTLNGNILIGKGPVE